MRIGAGLLQSAREPTLVVAELDGPAIALGRFQRLKTACTSGVQGATEVVRRNSGGRAIQVSQGTVGVLFAVPDPTALVGAPVPPDKVMNRFVRGLLAGLTRVGVPGGAHYFGRDFVSAQSKQLAVVGQDGTARAALFEAFVAVDANLQLPAALDGYPPHADPRARGPEHVSLAALRGKPLAFDPLAEAILEGYAGQHHRELAHIDAAELPEADLPSAAEDEAGFSESGVAEIPIGFLEALVRAEAGQVLEARLRGDFIAPAFVAGALEQSLRGCPLSFGELGKRVDAAFHLPGAAVVGVRELRLFAEAVLAAAAPE